MVLLWLGVGFCSIGIWFFSYLTGNQPVFKSGCLVCELFCLWAGSTLTGMPWFLGRVHEWCLACKGMLDPCSSSDNMAFLPLHLLGRVLSVVARFSVLHTFVKAFVPVSTNQDQLSVAPGYCWLRCEADPESKRCVSTFSCNSMLDCWHIPSCSSSWVRNITWICGLLATLCPIYEALTRSIRMTLEFVLVGALVVPFLRSRRP